MEVEKQYKRTYLLKDGTPKIYYQTIRYNTNGKRGRPTETIPEPVIDRFNSLIKNRKNKRKDIINIIQDETNYKLTLYNYHKLLKRFNENSD